MTEELEIQSLQAFRQMMDEALRTHDSWLALAGLFWLKPGVNSIGSDPAADVLLPAEHSPRHLGRIMLEDGHARLEIAPPNRVKIEGADVAEAALEPDTVDSPTIVHLGPLTWMVIERGERLAIRLWDNSRAEMHSFPGRRWYPEAPDLRITANFEPGSGAQKLRIENTIGDVEQVSAAGTLHFELASVPLSLQAMGDPSAGLSILFKDLTNGVETYAPGRYLTTSDVQEGRVLLDFNRAYNPPCAFTDFATCPLPPQENYLPVRIEAGEQMPVSYAWSAPGH